MLAARLSLICLDSHFKGGFMRYSIEITPFIGSLHSGCHWAVMGRSGFVWAAGCAGNSFEAVATAFSSARRVSRAKSFAVRVVA